MSLQISDFYFENPNVFFVERFEIGKMGFEL